MCKILDWAEAGFSEHGDTPSGSKCSTCLYQLRNYKLFNENSVPVELVPCHTRRRQTGGTGPHSAATRYGNAPDFVALRRILPVPRLCQGRPWPLAETGENHRMETRNIFYGRKTTWDTFSFHGAELQNLQQFNLI